VQAEKQPPQNYLQPCPDSYRDFFGYFRFIKKKKVTGIWRSKRTEQKIEQG
jgi:hypothetical protein